MSLQAALSEADRLTAIHKADAALCFDAALRHKCPREAALMTARGDEELRRADQLAFRALELARRLGVPRTPLQTGLPWWAHRLAGLPEAPWYGVALS